MAKEKFAATRMIWYTLKKIHVLVGVCLIVNVLNLNFCSEETKWPEYEIAVFMGNIQITILFLYHCMLAK